MPQENNLFLDIAQLKEIVEFANKHNFTYFEFANEDFRLSLGKKPEELNDTETEEQTENGN